MGGYVWDSLAVVICLGPKFCHWLDSSAPDSSAPASAWTALSEMAFSLQKQTKMGRIAKEWLAAYPLPVQFGLPHIMAVSEKLNLYSNWICQRSSPTYFKFYFTCCIYALLQASLNSFQNKVGCKYANKVRYKLSIRKNKDV